MNNFDKSWRSAKTSIFRLEGRPAYKVAGEQKNIAEWKKGELDLGGDKEWQKWMVLLKSAQTKKIAVQRVRVVPSPLPDYIKFEIDSWQKYSVKNGETFFFLDAKDYQEIITACGFNSKDFWLFDDQSLLIFNYDKSGQFTGEILIADGGMARRYSELKSKFLKKSLPLDQFVKKLQGLGAQSAK
ncbi:MAG: DUF6879 family protein [Candidatus Paceibacterota bacterium]